MALQNSVHIEEFAVLCIVTLRILVRVDRGAAKVPVTTNNNLSGWILLPSAPGMAEHRTRVENIAAITGSIHCTYISKQVVEIGFLVRIAT